jgi:MOSC domain-containing protein YiiM
MYEVGPHRYTTNDARRTFALAGHLWRHHVHGLTDVPRAATEAADSIADRLAERSGTDVPGAPSVAERLDGLGAAASEATGNRWSDAVVADELAALWAGFGSVADALRAAGVYGPTATGSVVQLSTSGGGVPKLPVDGVEVDHGGVVGDVQAARQHHGRPWQALCIWSSEVIDALAAAGHPIAPGRAGENVTIAGLDWPRVRPGAELQLGEVRCRVAAFAIPCSKNARWFLERRVDTMHHEAGPVSRVYATVVRPGRIATGDAAVLEPA